MKWSPCLYTWMCPRRTDNNGTRCLSFIRSSNVVWLTLVHRVKLFWLAKFTYAGFVIAGSWGDVYPYVTWSKPTIGLCQVKFLCIRFDVSPCSLTYFSTKTLNKKAHLSFWQYHVNLEANRFNNRRLLCIYTDWTNRNVLKWGEVPNQKPFSAFIVTSVQAASTLYSLFTRLLDARLRLSTTSVSSCLQERSLRLSLWNWMSRLSNQHLTTFITR